MDALPASVHLYRPKRGNCPWIESFLGPPRETLSGAGGGWGGTGSLNGALLFFRVVVLVYQ